MCFLWLGHNSPQTGPEATYWLGSTKRGGGRQEKGGRHYEIEREGGGALSKGAGGGAF